MAERGHLAEQVGDAIAGGTKVGDDGIGVQAALQALAYRRARSGPGLHHIAGSSSLVGVGRCVLKQIRKFCEYFGVAHHGCTVGQGTVADVESALICGPAQFGTGQGLR